MAPAKPKLVAVVAVAAVVILGGGAAFVALHKPDAAGKSAAAGASGSAGALRPDAARAGRWVLAAPAAAVRLAPQALSPFRSNSAISPAGSKPSARSPPRSRSVLSVNAADRVTGVFFEDGQRVRKGATLLTMQSDEENALLQQAQATAADAKNTYERNKRLAASNAVAQADLDKSRPPPRAPRPTSSR